MDNKQIVIVGGGGTLPPCYNSVIQGMQPFVIQGPRHLDITPSIGERLRGDVHMGNFHERPKGNNSFRHLPTVGGTPSAAKKRSKRKAEKKARKQSRK